MNTKSYVSAILSLAVLASAQSAVIDFEGYGNDYANVSYVDGFQLTTVASGWGILNDDVDFDPDFIRNGTTRYLMAGALDSEASLIMAREDSSAFSIQGFSSAYMFDRSSNSVKVVGYYAGGGSITETFAISNTFANFTLTGNWGNLESVVFSSGTYASFYDESGVSLDNIVVNEAGAPVPEPMTALVLAGGLAFFRRRRSAK